MTTKTAKDMNRGGTFIVETLKAMVETGRPSLKTRMLFVVFKLMAFTWPKRCLTENWPMEADGHDAQAKPALRST